MIKKFALLATVAALFVACSSESTETMEQATTTEAATEMLDAANAEAEVVVAGDSATEEAVLEEAAPEEGAAVETK
jgi:ABC-type Fe3+-hydroxamate transport system substrate-binding protein